MCNLETFNNIYNIYNIQHEQTIRSTRMDARYFVAFQF